MSVTIPNITVIPNQFTMNESEYNAAWYTLLGELSPYAQGANALAAEVEFNAANAEAAVASLASAKWVSGTYTQGDVAWSPTDYLNYRCKTTGSRTTDPSLDPTNWALLTKTGAGGSDTTSSATDITLTSTSGRLQIISMTASGKKVTQPAATTLDKGAPIFVYQNAGIYRFSVHKNGGGFLCHVNPGHVVMVHCSDTSTGAGVWHVSGQDVNRIYGGNTAEVLNAVDSRNIAVAMLSATKAICVFRNNSTTYLNAVILNYGSASGAPSAINAEASANISIAAQTASQATVIYKTSSGVTKGYVLDVSGNTITPGSVATIDATAGGAQTDIAALSSTKLLCVYQSASAGTVRERVLDISASAITPSAEAVADSTAAENYGLNVRAISPTKAIVGFRLNSVGDPVPMYRLQSISGSTPAATGSALTLDPVGANTADAKDSALEVLSATRAVAITSEDGSYSSFSVSVIDISGSSPVLVGIKPVRVDLASLGGSAADPLFLYGSRLDANTVYLTWNGGASLGVDAMLIRVTGDDDIIVSAVSTKLEANTTAASHAKYLACAALDANHVMQVARNANTYLSAKTIEIGA